MRPNLCGVVLIAVAFCTGCGLTVKGQPVPRYRQGAALDDFAAAPGDMVLHYYGAGGWGLKWRGSYTLFAPYFSNHTLPRLSMLRHRPDLDAIRAGFAATPVERTRLVLLGHGHVDHAGDLSGFFQPGLIPPQQAALIADRSAVNQLGRTPPPFGCIEALELTDQGKPVKSPCVPDGLRVTPLHGAHAPHVRILGLDVTAYGDVVAQPQEHPPRKGGDFQLGHPWAFLVDLIDAEGAIAFRIHYMDAAQGPPHGYLPGDLPDGRAVDVAIICAPGADLVPSYPDAVLDWGKTRYVMLGHWEDFFRPATMPLRGVPMLVGRAELDRLADVVDHTLGRTPRGMQPRPGVGCHPKCGPRGANWALPIPGETFQFAPLP